MATVIFKTKVGEFYEIIPNEYNVVQMQVEQEGFQYTMQDSDFVETFEEFATAFSIIEPYTFEVDDGQSVFLKSNTVGAVVINEGTAVEFVALDSRLVSAVIPTRDLWALRTQMSGQTFDPEDGVIRSDGNGVQGVLDDGSMYIGEGYENLLDDKQDLRNWDVRQNGTLEILSENKNIQNVRVTQGDGASQYTLGYSVPITDNGIFTGTIKNNSNISLRVSCFPISGIIEIPIGETVNFVSQGGLGVNLLLIGTNIKQSHGTQYEFEIKREKMFTKTSQQVPFVKTTAPDGRLVISESWTSSTHTFINLDENYLEQETYISLGTINPYLKLDGVTRNNYMKGLFIYEGLLTPQEIADEIVKIQSGNYRIPAGITKPLEL